MFFPFRRLSAIHYQAPAQISEQSVLQRTARQNVQCAVELELGMSEVQEFPNSLKDLLRAVFQFACCIEACNDRVFHGS